MTDSNCLNCRYSFMDISDMTCNRYAPRVDFNVDSHWARWPLVEADNWCGEWEPEMGPDSDPPVSLQDVRALADFMAHAGAMPLLDGFDGPSAPPSPDAPPAPAKPEFLTYDEPFEDPLK